VVQFHLDTVFDADRQQTDREHVADEGQTVGGEGSGQFVGGQLGVLGFRSRHNLILDLIDREQFSALDAFFEGPDEVILVVIVVFDYFPFYFSEEVEDGVIDEGQHDEDGDQLRPVGRNELDCGDENDQVLVDAEDTVAGDVNLLVILQLKGEYVVVAVREFNVVLLGVPREGFVCQIFEAFTVDPVADGGGNNCAELPLEVDESCQDKGQNEFGDHHVLVFRVVLIPVLFFEVTDVEVDEDVQHFGSQDDED
jgi:hypothetical protein